MGYFSGSSDNLLNSPEEIANAVQGVRGLRSQQLPRVTGGAPIPVVSGLRVVSTTLLNGGNTSVVLSWYEPAGYSGSIAGHNVYALGALTGAIAPQLVSAGFSPAVFQIGGVAAGTPVTFYVQTVMKDGQTSTIANSPTVVALTL